MLPDWFGEVAASSVPATLAALLLVVLWTVLRVGSRDPRLPKGPSTLPIIGNAHLIPKTGLHNKFPEWAKKYGKIFSLKVGPGTIIVLCDRKAIHKLLVEKGSILSDRPPNYVSNFITRGDHVIIESLTPLARLKRRIITSNYSAKEVDSRHSATQNAEATILLMNFLTNPEGWHGEIRRYTLSVVSSITWGHRVPDTETPWYKKPYDLLDKWMIATENGANPPIDAFPFLAWAPPSLAFWKRRAIALRAQMDETWSWCRDAVERRRAQGDKRNSIIDTVLDEYEAKGWPEGLTQHALNNLMGEIIEGGSDTTSSQLQTIVLALAMHPQYQERARREIDAVCGTERSPDFPDFAKIPYVNCLIKEAVRWQPSGMINLPHYAREDTEYEGMLIPKGATVFLPIAAMHHDEERYEDIHRYNPDRFLKLPALASDYAASSDYNNRDHYVYGAGRRICPGIHLAERSMWRIVAKILWAFEVAEPVDPVTGKTVSLADTEFCIGAVNAPVPFNVQFKLRSEAHKAVLEREHRMALDYMQKFE